MGACAITQGLTFYLLGAATVGRAVQYIPSPVTIGYLASIGYLLLSGTSSMLTGCSFGGCIRTNWLGVNTLPRQPTYNLLKHCTLFFPCLCFLVPLSHPRPSLYSLAILF